jgi:exopolysaccharide biosynthesis polyprenyl glycosylphosphotransferase
VGYLGHSLEVTSKHFYGQPLLGSETDLLEVVDKLNIQEVIVAIERNLEKELFSLLVDCRANGVRVSWMPNLYEKLLRSVPIQHIDPAWALHALQDKPIFNRLPAIGKRFLDLLLVFLVSPLILVVIPLVALAVRLDSPGPAFYRQTRAGVAGKPFSIFKFRTMFVDAEKDGKAKWAKSGDPRITRLGRFLRKARLDELPQLYNVLKGEMSIVGPRPERPEFIEMLEKEVPFYKTRLTVKPGITGWAQVHYDYGNSVEDALIKLQYDFYYIRYQSLALDIYIMFRTISVLLKLKGT